MQRLGGILPVLAAIAYAASASVGGSGILCIGEDGHFEIGAACEPCCSEGVSAAAARPNRTAELARADAEDCCGPCLDVPLAGEHITGKGRVNPEQGGPDLTVLLAVAAAPVTSAGPQASPAEILPDPPLESLSTIILLC